MSVAVLVGTSLATQFRPGGEAVPIRRPLDTLSHHLGDWQAREATVLEVEVLNILKVKDYLMRRYVDGSGRSLWLYIGYWDVQRRGAQMHSPKNCLPGSGWEAVESAIGTVPLHPPDRAIAVNRYLVQKGTEQQLVLYWYQYQRHAVAGEVDARLHLVKNSVVRNRTDGALVRVSMPVHGTQGETHDRLVTFVQHLYPLLARHLPD